MTTSHQGNRGAWSAEDFGRIAAADELRVAPMRADGTPRDPTTIWVVGVEGRLYIRSAYSTRAAWWRAAHRAGHGRVHAPGMERTVEFVDVLDERVDAIDSAYRTKYRRYSASLVNTMVTPEARATTLELKPRATG